MAEEIQEQTTPEVDEEQLPAEETDWQAKYEAMREHMRDWEKKAKENQSAADELEKLRAEQMSEQEKVTARAEKAEAELAALKAEAARHQAAREIAEKEGIPASLLEYCADEEAMKEFAKAYKAEQPEAHSAARATGSRIVRSGEAAPTNADMFAEQAAQLFNK